MKANFNTDKYERRFETTTYDFRKETYEVLQPYYIEKETGEEVTTTKDDELIVTQVHNLYREKHHIPFPAEIKAIRNKYGLSAAKMSEVLDLGANSYRNYENGEVPSLANAKLIRLAGDPDNFKRFIEEKREIFSDKAYKKLEERIYNLLKTDKMETVVEYIWNFHLEANAFTGFVKPSFEKVAHFVMFFAEKARPLKTRLNKLLFFSDFLHYKETGFAISGCNYRAIPYGPVPSHFHELFGLLETENYISIEQEMSENGHMGERFVANKTFNPDLFTPEEIAHMERVVETFSDMRTRQLIELSHGEAGWKENQQQRELINFQEYAFRLQAL